MTAEISPLLFPDLYDAIYIGGVRSPGICKVSGASRKHDWDVKRGPGTQGATETYRGKPPADGIKVTFTLWLQEHFDAWVAFQPLLEYDPTKAVVKAVDIFAPQLDELAIVSVVVTDIGQLEEDEPTKWKRTVSFLEYFPAKKKNATSSPTSSTTNNTTGTSGTAAPSAQDAQQAEIAKLLAEAQKP